MMNIKVIYSLCTAISVIGLFPVLFGIVDLIRDNANGGIIQILFGVILISISFSIYQITLYIEKQSTYFKNRISALEKQVDNVKKEYVNKS
ncbi:hypothetical protein [Tenuibacillus multivorans]|uniref:Uncharacterized protein n=1 Tax=Tenuibacillus multivorans TaxID=237069 RepID=A0A1G9Y5G2_9BACI|nr:hypothetical protein [Tenuibacillus multivorans]GEL75938.1 hypothetical protein TMU01_01730 [Tenuibacillus multivorans]SDN03733.1 hypothetical protein SAMN05216498_1232 [Tenuibacillus multivorans]